MNADPTEALLERARAGDSAALSAALAQHSSKLERMVALRMDSRLARRFEAADVVQDALLEAAQRFPEWCAQQRYPFSVWLRLLTSQKLQSAVRDSHRQKRDIAREQPAAAHSSLTASGAADWWISTHTSPTQAARRGELRERVLAALEELGELDREVLVLRYFEELSNEETAAELGIDADAASKRFARALQRIRPALRALSDEDRRNAP